jgi:hypothetical protein
MARRDFRRGAAAIRRSRETRWLSLAPSITAFSAIGGTLLFSLDTDELSIRPFTIIRTHLQIGVLSDQLIASEDQVGAIGVAVVSSQSEAVGVTAIPTPITDIGSDLWMLHQIFMNEFTIISSVGFNHDGWHQYAIDSKAMRKVEDGQDVVVVAELSGVSSGFVLTVGGRMLVKLH